MIQATKGKDSLLLATQLVTDGATCAANLDCKAADFATIRVNCSIEESTDAVDSTLSLLECDTTVVTDFATIVADETIDLVAAKEVRYEVDMLGRKRYLRLAFTAGTETGGEIMIGAIATLTRNDEAPKNTTQMQVTPSDAAVIIV